MEEKRTERVGIKATYWISSGPQTEESTTVPTTIRIFDETNTAKIRVGLSVGSVPVKPPPGDDLYSGMHDQGPLPEIKEGGPMALLVGCAQAAKVYNNDFMTQQIHDEKKRSESATKGSSFPIPSKKKKKM